MWYHSNIVIQKLVSEGLSLLKVEKDMHIFCIYNFASLKNEIEIDTGCIKTLSFKISEPYLNTMVSVVTLAKKCEKQRITKIKTVLHHQ